MLKEFKAFIMKGNLLDLAVAVILALAFATVVNSFVADIITPIIAAIFGQPDFSSLKIDIGDGVITYGNFLNALLSLVIVGFVLFLVIKAYNRLAGEKEASTKDCPFCMTAVPLAASRCPACTSQLEGAA